MAAIRLSTTSARTFSMFFAVIFFTSEPVRMKRCSSISSATEAQASALTSWLKRTESSPSVASLKVLKSNSATHRPRTRSPRNSNRS